MIRFSRYIWVYFFISSLVLVPGIYSLARFGLRPSIDFTGGTLAEIHFDKSLERARLEKILQNVGIGNTNMAVTSNNSILFRLPPDSESRVASFTAALKSEASVSSELVRLETVGPILGKELLQKATVAATIAILGILLYVAWAFKNMTYGISAIVALAHDLLIVLGTFSLFGKFWGVEVDTLFVTALLTTMSFSVHDTIVVFDRIREMTKRGERGSIYEISDVALTQTMVRSLTNSFTIMFMLVALVLMGGSTIRWLAVALLIGTISGTYSSPFIATPILLIIHSLQLMRKRDLRGKN